MKGCILIHRHQIDRRGPGDNYDTLQYQHLQKQLDWPGFVISSPADIPDGYNVLLGAGIRFWTGASDFNIRNYSATKKSITVEFQDGYGYKNPILADLCLYHVKRPTDIVDNKSQFKYVGVGVQDEYLYPEQDKNNPVAFLDHWHPRGQHMDRSFQLAQKLKLEGWQIYHLNYNGLVLNDFEQSSVNYKTVKHEDVCAALRRSHLFIMTHVETQGMTQIEAGLCGAAIVGEHKDLSPYVLQSLPFYTIDQFDLNIKIDFKKNSIEAKKQYSFSSFRENVLLQIKQYILQHRI